jgi:hypothetical protein
MVKRFTIYGERSSGTNYLEQLITTNFGLPITWDYGWKHFFGYSNFNNSDDTLFFGIVRSPVAWIDSFFKNPFYVPKQNTNIKNFLSNKFFSIDKKNQIMKEDLNYTNNQVYSNIFELRKVKNDYLLDIMPNKVKNYALINYEYIKAEPFEFLEAIRIKFGLTKLHETYKNIDYYKTAKNVKYVEHPVTLGPQIISFIKQNLNAEQEQRLNYKL